MRRCSWSRTTTARTRRKQAWPREAAALMRECSALFAGLDRRLGEWGVPEGQPFPISPMGEYDGGLADDITEC
jgi:hypothetical protein